MIMITMCIEVSIPHGLPLAQIAFTFIMRCRDRSCTCDKKKSKTVLQSEYEDMYTGPEF
jgi:hypothetical protein